MSATNQILPKGGYNNIGFDYWTPQTAAQTCVFYTSTAATTAFFKLNVSGAAIEVDTINELTSANGIAIDSVRLKDGGVRQANAAFFLGRNAADTADVNLFKLNSSDGFEFAPTTFLCSTNLHITPNTTDGSDNQYIKIGGTDNTRGAHVVAYGNENGSTGILTLSSGNVSGGAVNLLAPHSAGTINCYTGGNLRWSVDASGNLSSNSTNGQDVIFNKTGTGPRTKPNGVGLVAGGSDQSGATAITYTVEYISSGTGGVRLPVPSTTSIMHFIYNFTGSAVNVYPQSGGTINSGSANTPVSLSALNSAIFWNTTNTAWICIRGS